MNLIEVYNTISTDKIILQRYKQIEEFEQQEGGFAYHNFEHVKNVTILIEKILTQLNYDVDFILKAKIASILHDTGAIEGKNNHAYKSYEFSTKYFKTNNIVFDDMNMVLEAIKIHSDGFNTDNKIALSLILADKLDIKKTRISEEGKNVIGNRQYCHISDIDFRVDQNQIIIKFTTDGEVNSKEISEYYFTKKVFKAVEVFANKVNLSYQILLDDAIWTI